MPNATKAGTQLDQKLEDLKKLLRSKSHDELLAMMTPEQRALVKRIRGVAAKVRMTEEEFQQLLDDSRDDQ